MKFPLKEIRHVIPINPWNKKVKGIERGKTPVDYEWSDKQYNTTEAMIAKWQAKGYNIGYRIPADRLVVDIDPRNGAGRKVRRSLAVLFGFNSFEKFTESTYTVRTGGGGWHLYCKFGKEKSVNYREIHESLPGVEFKKLGRQVLCAGSRHPSGNFYKLLCDAKFMRVPKPVLKLLYREAKTPTIGGGEFNSVQLGELLDLLPATDYTTNDTWQPIAMAAHHATAGQGIEEFVRWCMTDPAWNTKTHAAQVRKRWDSFNHDHDTGFTYRTLRRELELRGLDAGNFVARAEFAEYIEDAAFDAGFEEDETVPVEDAIEEVSDKDLNREAMALQAGASDDEIMVLVRKLRVAPKVAGEFAKNIIVRNGVLSKSMLNQLIKVSGEELYDDISRKLAEHVLRSRFNDGQHIAVLQNDSTWIYRKTHWQLCGEYFLKRLILNTLDKNRAAIAGPIKLNEVSVVNGAMQAIRSRRAFNDMRVIDDPTKLRIVNCRNGELWLNRDGTYDLKKHTAPSYLLSVLPVVYKRKAKAKLWLQTLGEIFDNDKDMVRHLAEVLGYMLQPDKNIASWFLFRGPGGDGKSTIIKVLAALMGDALLMSQVKLLSLGGNNGNNHASASLVGKLCVVIEEIPSYGTLNDTGLKMLSERTRMEANPKGQDAFMFDYVGGLIMCSNHWPQVRDLSEGMRRRANVVPFTKEFVRNGEADINRVTDITSSDAEMSGVLVWLLEGLARLRERGRFKIPACCVEATGSWFRQANQVTEWADEYLKVKNGQRVEFKEAYMLYEQWASLSNLVVINKNEFKRSLQSLGWGVQYGAANRQQIHNCKIRK